MIVRRTPAEVNVALAGITLVASFARFKALMAAFSEERAQSCSFCLRDLSAMVETQGNCEKVQRVCREEELAPNRDERRPCYSAPRAIGLVW